MFSKPEIFIKDMQGIQAIQVEEQTYKRAMLNLLDLGINSIKELTDEEITEIESISGEYTA